MMADHAARTSSQYAVVTREVARHTTNGRTLQATSRVYRRRRYARDQRESQNRGHQIPFHRISLIAGVNARPPRSNRWYKKRSHCRARESHYYLALADKRQTV